MVTPAEKRSSKKFCDFHNDKGHSTDECMQLKKQIEELMRRMTRQKLTQSFARSNEITFPPLANNDGTEGSLVIEAEIGGHMIHRIPLYKAWMNFLIVRVTIVIPTGMHWKTWNREIQAVPSTAHGMLKFPANRGIVTIRSTILIPAECTTVITSSKEVPKEAEVRPKNFKIALHPNFPDQEVAIGGTLSTEGRTELCSLLKKNLDIFAWQPSDMTGVPRSVAEHRLNIREGYSPVRQKKRGQAPERSKAIQAEVQKLVEAGIMREVYYHDWLSNPVMDCYPLPEIDWKVESLCGYPFKCFLDAYKGYHQIQMAESDEEKTAFHTSQGVYCYTKMPFGLKNAGATYQRLVDKAFDSQVGWNMEVYVDDLVIKSHTEEEMIRDIKETFRTLQRINMKLNPKKCTFGAREGMFLGYMIIPEGIKPFLSTLAEKSLPLFKTLKKCIKKSDFHWTPEAEQAFTQLKQHLSELPLLVAPKPKEKLIVYLAASHGAISVVLMTERATVQTPVYFVIRALQGPELNYSPMEKLVLSLVFTAKRLRRKITKIERHAGRTQYHLPAKDVYVRTDPSRFPPSNNEAEYEALIAGLRIAAQMGVRNVRVLVEILKEKSIHEEEVATVVEEEGTTWMTPIIEYLKDGTLLGDRKEASKLRIKARQYELLEGILYMRSFLKPWLRCVGPLQADYVIREIHEGSCSMHAGPRSVVAKAMRNPQHPLTPITAPWPFYKWGIDIAGPFPEGSGKVKFLIVAINYFTKWIEAKAVATITGNQMKKFVWDNIVCRFGLLGEIISDNGKQFSDNPFKDWCDKLNITQRFTSVKHPQSNGLVERENWSLGEGIKARLGEGNKNWVEELPHVLWAHRTMIKSCHGDTPFSLTYGTEAVIPAKIRMPTYRTAAAKMKMTKYYNARVRDVAFRPGDFVYRSNDASHAVAGEKLGPKWEGPYEVTEALGDGAYKLRTMAGADLPRTWNIANLKKCYL
ncbi:reverse transcriptase domain-containing protein [Tanacetum coccineum]